ncbi:MAG: ATP-binding domain-containing protein, partial [Clostridia bacterium]|nr:ATP-binding domain-containing protein [Clostridia bacterium]
VPLPKDVYKQLEKSGLVDVLGAETMAGRRKYYVENVKAALREIVERSVSGKEIMEHAAAVDAFGSGDGSSGVYMSTIHSAKGLEYDAVMIIDCVKGEFPFGSLSGDALSEERRLLYVAMTRAAGDLYITYPRRCGRLELLPGEFLEELKDCV